MPDQNGNLLPSDEGYVTQIEAKQVVSEQPTQLTPLQELQDAEQKLAEQSEKANGAYVSSVPEGSVPLDKYNALLSAYNSLKGRVSIDAQFEKQLDAQAGLI